MIIKWGNNTWSSIFINVRYTRNYFPYVGFFLIGIAVVFCINYIVKLLNTTDGKISLILILTWETYINHS